ncbi:MAG: chloramphenicol acetyltransferase [Bacteroidota bacterium]
MKKIQYDNPYRRKHFEFFNNMASPHFGVCANVEISNFRTFVKREGISFNTAMVYVVCKTANSIREFRHRIRGEEVVEHDLVHPSFAVPTKIADVFSFCYVDYQADFEGFVRAASARIELMQSEPSIEDEPGRDDYLFLSSFPWASFTSVQHPMPLQEVDSVPRIVWGKFFESNGKIMMPLSVHAHHAVVDGSHLGLYFQRFQDVVSAF